MGASSLVKLTYEIQAIMGHDIHFYDGVMCLRVQVAFGGITCKIA